MIRRNLLRRIARRGLPIVAAGAAALGFAAPAVAGATVTLSTCGASIHSAGFCLVTIGTAASAPLGDVTVYWNGNQAAASCTSADLGVAITPAGNNAPTFPDVAGPSINTASGCQAVWRADAGGVPNVEVALFQSGGTGPTSGTVTVYADTPDSSGYLNNLHDDLFVVVGAIVGAALIPLIAKWFLGTRG